MLRFSTLSLYVVLSGCGTTAGVREFQAYSAAFSAVEEASDAVLIDIAAGERAARINQIDGRAQFGISTDLDSRDLSTFAPNADPTFVAAVRYAINSVERYNQTLLAYAEGRSLSILKGQISDLNNASIGFTAMPPVKGADLLGKIGFLKDLLDVAVGVGSREAFRIELREGGEALGQVLDEILKYSDVAFDMLTGTDFRELRVVSGGNETRAAALRTSIAKKREMLAEWLYLLQQARAALDGAVRAIDVPQTAGQRLVETAVIVGDLRARAERIKKLAVEN